MLLERLRWLLPALMIFWTNPQLGASLPAHDERAHVPANIFYPSAATSTMIRQEYNKHSAHLTDGKNNTQPSHKLVASPAGLLRPDKFQFYTYNDKGDMITRQMTVQEIQGLIAAGGADHVAMDRQEPQKAGDVLTGGKKVMDVVQKVQSVLKSALDKPPTLTGTIPKIPEHANVEWSNILPSILSGETDAIPPGGEFALLSQKPAIEKDTAPNVATGATSGTPAKRPIATPNVQTNVYGGFANNSAQHEKKPTEKPMIPVPVITLTEQKLSTLQSAMTESPIFQMLSVIPAEAVESDHKEQQTVSAATDAASLAVVTTERAQADQHFVEVNLTEVPEATTLSLSTGSDMQPVNTYDITKNITTSLDNKVDHEMTTSVYYSMTMPSVSESTPDAQKTVASGETSTSTTDRISSSSASYVVIMQSENNTAYDDSPFVPGVTTESEVSATYDQVITQTTQAAASTAPASELPLSHAPPKPDQAPSKTSSVSSAPGLELSTVPSHAADQLGSATVTRGSSSSVTPAAHRDSQPTEAQSRPMEPLPTQLVDSLSSVMSQVSEVRPPVLSLPSNDPPGMMPIVNVDQRRNDSGQVANTQRDEYTSEAHTISADIYTTLPMEALLPVVTVQPAVQQPGAVNRESLASSETSPSAKIATTTASATSEAMNSDMAVDSSAITPEKLSDETTIQPEKIPDASSLESQTDAALKKQPAGETTSFVRIPSTAAMAPPEARPTTTDKSSSEPAPTGETLEVTLAKVNLSNPVSAVDQILNIAPLPSSTPFVEPIALPTHAPNLAASDLASGLIAGFATPPVVEVDEDQAATNASNVLTARPASSDAVNHADEIESTAQTESTEFQKSDDRKEGNVTYAQTTQPSLSSSSIMNDRSETNEPAATEATELSSNSERIDDPASPSAILANTTENTKDSVEQTAAGIVTAAPAKPSTPGDVPQPSLNETPSAESNEREKTENEKKTKPTTEASVVRTDASPGESRLPVKVTLIEPAGANDTAHSTASVSTHAEKIENQTSSELLASILPATEEAAPHSTDNSELHENTSDASNVTFHAAIADENSTDSSSQGLSPSNAEIDLRDDSNRTAGPSSEDNHDGSLSASSEKDVSTAKPIAGIGASSGNASDSKQELTQNLNNTTSNSNSVENISSQSKKPAPPRGATQSTNVSGSSMTGGSINGQLNKTESKLASLKHSENPTPKPEVAASSTPAVHQASKPTVGHREPAEKLDVASTTDANAEDKWTLITQIPSGMKLPKPPRPSKPPSRKPPASQATSPATSGTAESANVRITTATEATQQQDQQDSTTQSVLPLDASQSASGLDVTVSRTSADIVNFAQLCNELAFNFWVAINKGLSTARSLALSPFGMTSLLAMIFLGARGPTSDQMNEVLGLDDVTTFNPHLVFQNITDAVGLARDQGIANAAFVRELFADKMKVRKLMPFYKEQAQQFYEGLVTEVNFATIGDLVRRRTNLLVRKQTGGRVKDFVRTSTVPLRSPLAALSANVFQTDCNSSLTSSAGRDGELYFAVSPAIRQRKLVPVPATTWRSGVLAGYEPSIDATAVALGGTDKLVSTVFVLPGQQGHTAPGDTLDRLEQRLVRSAIRDGAWNKLLKVLIPRNSLELQMPKFSHRSVINATAALKRMGLDELFSGNADFKGINGIGHRLHLADVLQLNLFSTCGDENILNGRHHVETYPATPLKRSVQRHMGEDIDVAEDVSSGETRANEWREDSHREGRQAAGLPAEKPRLKLDRPFLYFVRHNPSGIILHMGRFNPRLLS